MIAYRLSWSGFRAYVHVDMSRCLRDEEAAGSNPATPTTKWQVTRYPVVEDVRDGGLGC
jgi:hypothetical protein